jgi:RND superfamily putative drug exporter
VIRGVVVPAFLRVAGDLNWWAPRPLKRLHARIGFREAPRATTITPPTRHAPAKKPQQVVTHKEPRTVAADRPAAAAREVEVIPGRHLVTNVNGTVIVVADRGLTPLSPKSIAVKQLSALVAIVRRTDSRRLASVLSRLALRSEEAVDFGIVTPTEAGLDVYLCGAVTVALDNGVRTTLLHGAPLLRVHRSAPMPAAGAAVTVDEAGELPLTRVRWTGVYTLSAGTVLGHGAIIAPRSDTLSSAPTVQIMRHAGIGPSRLHTVPDRGPTVPQTPIRTRSSGCRIG